jgi:hypothetical protein
MAYVAPSTVTTLQTYTSAAHNVIVNDIIDHETRLNSYSGVYTNEAARDAAITSPVEGMSVYLTAPTVPAATGTNTYLPSGVRTVYNGSVWVCVTAVGANTSAGGTSGATNPTYTTTLGGSPGTNPTVTLVTGTTALISIAAMNTAPTASTTFMSVSVSGASTVAGTDMFGTFSFNPGTTQQYPLAKTFVLGGLTAGTNTFSLCYSSNGGGPTLYQRHICVGGIA